MIIGIPPEQVDFFGDKLGDLHTLSGQPIKHSHEDPIHLMLKSGVLALAKPGIYETGDTNYDLGGDVDYLADELEDLTARKLRDAGWTRARLATSVVSFSEPSFSAYIQRTRNETSEAGDIVTQHIGVNHQLTAIKPLSFETQSQIAEVRFQPEHYAALVIFIRSGVQPNVELHATEEVNEDEIFARARPDTTRAGWNQGGTEQLTDTDRHALNNLYEEFRKASEWQLLKLENGLFRYRLPLL